MVWGIRFFGTQKSYFAHFTLPTHFLMKTFISDYFNSIRAKPVVVCRRYVRYMLVVVLTVRFSDQGDAGKLYRTEKVK